MMVSEKIAKISALIGDSSRAEMLLSLMGGLAQTAGELALKANISPQTASNHLKRLSEANLVYSESIGRYKYYQLATPFVAGVIEAIMLIDGSHMTVSATGKRVDSQLTYARTCYDHLAGKLGVKIAEAMVKKDYLTCDKKDFSPTRNGYAFFEILDIDCVELKKLKRQFSKCCLDWTEKKFHIAGSLGSAILSYFIKNRLALQSKNKNRVVFLTAKGKLWLKENLM